MCESKKQENVSLVRMFHHLRKYKISSTGIALHHCQRTKRATRNMHGQRHLTTTRSDISSHASRYDILCHCVSGDFVTFLRPVSLMHKNPRKDASFSWTHKCECAMIDRMSHLCNFESITQLTLKEKYQLALKYV